MALKAWPVGHSSTPLVYHNFSIKKYKIAPRRHRFYRSSNITRTVETGGIEPPSKEGASESSTSVG